MLATALTHAVVFMLGGGVEQATARLVGMAVGATLLGSLGILAFLLPHRNVVVLAIALYCVLAGSIAGGVFFEPGSIALIVRTGQASLVVMPLAVLTLLTLRAAEAYRTGVAGTLEAVVPSAGQVMLLVCMAAAAALYVWASRRILFWDWSFYWSRTDALADLVRHAQWQIFVNEVALSVGDEYSLVPSALPSLLMALLPGGSLLRYAVSVTACYLVPTLLAVGALGFALACTLTPAIDQLPRRERLGLIALGAFAALLLLPHFLQVVLRYNMLDVGGVALLVALAFAWRCMLHTLVSPSGDVARQASRVLATAASVTVLSVLSFLFRRWYLFDVLGFAVAALCCLIAVRPSGGRPWPDMLGDFTIAAAVSLLTAIAIATPVLMQRVLEWRYLDYAELLAPYWGGWPSVIDVFKQEFGLLVPVMCAVFAVVLLVFGRERTLPLMLVLGTLVGIFGFLQLQGPGVQHFYLMMPLLGSLVAGGAILLARKVGAKPAFFILVAAGWFLGAAPRYGGIANSLQPIAVDLWPQRDADADELARLGHWLESALGAEERYCVVASGVAINSSLLANVWQVDTSLIGGKAAARVIELPQVDTIHGPPTDALEHCSLMITATPPQTILNPSDQQSILLLLDDLLNKRGVGAAYERLDTAFRLPSGVTLEIFRQRHPIGVDAIRDLRRRFYVGKGATESRYEQRFGTP